MRELWDKWKHPLIFCVCAWVLLAFVVLMERSSSHLFSSETGAKIWKIFGDIILFKGVSKYQTLLAGLAAIIGGSFVLITAKMSSAKADEARLLKQRQDAIAACTLVSIEFRQAAYQMIYYKYENDIPYFTNTASFLPKLANIDPMLADIVASCKNNAMLFLMKDRQNSSVKSLHTTALECYMIWQILLYVAENIKPDGSFDLRNTSKIPPKDMWPVIKSLLAQPKDAIGYWAFFDWQHPSTHPAASAPHQPKS